MSKERNGKKRSYNSLKRAKRKCVYRSHFEDEVISKLKKKANKEGITWEYESIKIDFNIPSTYLPDIIFPNGMIVEIKGLFTAQDRRKHLLIKEQHPEYDIRFVFQNPNNKIHRRSQTTYADWCEKHGFKWAKKEIPQHWLKEVAK